ncbi:MAG TPA: ATP-binding protein [Elusimicrobiota bacterium]|nr:ATP-binding protein [Elusimicrobiota bacterium]
MKPLHLTATATAPAPAQADEPRIRILLIDDQPANLLSLESLLEPGGYEIVKAPSGAEGLRRMLEQEFALVLLDVLMPGMDGFETAAMIRARQQSRHTPIIFITASNSDDTHVTRGYSLGAVDYIYKPIVPEILKTKVQVFAELHRKTQRLQTSERALRRELDEHAMTAAARRESEEKYRELFERVADSIIVYDPETGRIIDANHAASQLYGHSREELLRLKKKDLVADADALPPARGSAKSISRGRTKTRHRTKDGRVFRAEISRVVLNLGGRAAIMTLTRDLTERERAEEAERLRQREAMQRQMIATVSHELRTPIAAIKASAETLHSGSAGTPRERARFLEIIESHADRLSAIVENLLIDAEIESGKIQPKPAHVPLKQFTEQLLQAMSPLTERRGVAIELRAESDVSVFIDPEHLSRILHNLVDNAIKYSRKNGRVEVRAARGGPDEARISIIDDGIGIDADDLPFIFQQFFRSEKARALSIKGTGLGLSILKTLVEANGGRIWVESEKGKGSAFHFTAPLAKRKPHA